MNSTINKMVKAPLFMLSVIAMLTMASQPWPTTASTQTTQQTDLDQSRVCHVQESHLAGQLCQEGEIMLFVPASPMGASKTAIVLSSLVCDYRFNIERNADAMACVFTKKRSHQWESFGMVGSN